MTTETVTATELATFATYLRNALDRRDWAVCQAHDEGMSLRAIADAVGMSHMGVKKVIERRDRP